MVQGPPLRQMVEEAAESLRQQAQKLVQTVAVFRFEPAAAGNP